MVIKRDLCSHNLFNHLTLAHEPIRIHFIGYPIPIRIAYRAWRQCIDKSAIIKLVEIYPGLQSKSLFEGLFITNLTKHIVLFNVHSVIKREFRANKGFLVFVAVPSLKVPVFVINL